jgi:hypothetical protein
MWNAKTGSAGALFLAASVVLIAGCDVGAVPRQARSEAPELQPPGARIRVDAARNRVWTLTPEGVVLFEGARQERVAVPLPGWIWAAASYGCLPDLALGPRGEVMVTSNVVPTLWRIDPGSLAVSVHALALDADGGRDVGFTGLAFSPKHGAYFASSEAHGSRWRIDPMSGTARKLAHGAPAGRACVARQPPAPSARAAQ